MIHGVPAKLLPPSPCQSQSRKIQTDNRQRRRFRHFAIVRKRQNTAVPDCRKTFTCQKVIFRKATGHTPRTEHIGYIVSVRPRFTESAIVLRIALQGQRILAQGNALGHRTPLTIAAL